MNRQTAQRSRPVHLFRLFAALTALLVLCACAASGTTAGSSRTGMHIDAVFAFAVEHPLDWSKDRRQRFGSRNGEVRWTDAAQPGLMLQIGSTESGTQSPDMEQLASEAVAEYAGLQVSERDQLELSGGLALHIAGETTDSKVDIYLLQRPGRLYRIVFIAPTAQAEDSRALLQEILDSFQALAPTGPSTETE